MKSFLFKLFILIFSTNSYCSNNYDDLYLSKYKFTDKSYSMGSNTTVNGILGLTKVNSEEIINSSTLANYTFFKSINVNNISIIPAYNYNLDNFTHLSIRYDKNNCNYLPVLNVINSYSEHIKYSWVNPKKNIIKDIVPINIDIDNAPYENLYLFNLKRVLNIHKNNNWIIKKYSTDSYSDKSLLQRILKIELKDLNKINLTPGPEFRNFIQVNYEITSNKNKYIIEYHNIVSNTSKYSFDINGYIKDKYNNYNEIIDNGYISQIYIYINNDEKLLNTIKPEININLERIIEKKEENTLNALKNIELNGIENKEFNYNTNQILYKLPRATHQNSFSLQKLDVSSDNLKECISSIKSVNLIRKLNTDKLTIINSYDELVNKLGGPFIDENNNQFNGFKYYNKTTRQNKNKLTISLEHYYENNTFIYFHAPMMDSTLFASHNGNNIYYNTPFLLNLNELNTKEINIDLKERLPQAFKVIVYKPSDISLSNILYNPLPWGLIDLHSMDPAFEFSIYDYLTNFNYLSSSGIDGSLNALEKVSTYKNYFNFSYSNDIANKILLGLKTKSLNFPLDNYYAYIDLLYINNGILINDVTKNFLINKTTIEIISIVVFILSAIFAYFYIFSKESLTVNWSKIFAFIKNKFVLFLYILLFMLIFIYLIYYKDLYSFLIVISSIFISYYFFKYYKYKNLMILILIIFILSSIISSFFIKHIPEFLSDLAFFIFIILILREFKITYLQKDLR